MFQISDYWNTFIISCLCDNIFNIIFFMKKKITFNYLYYLIKQLYIYI